MRKICSLVLAVVLLCTVLVLPASAYSSKKDKGTVWEYGEFDLKLGEEPLHVVYYPKAMDNSSEKWPVVVWANGTGCAPAFYDKLFKGIAESGYVVVASSNVMSADGKDQRKSIDYIYSLNDAEGSPFYQKIDKDRIAAVGHSQGGRSSVNAAQDDKRIKCVVSIAGSNFGSEVKGLRTPTFFITGTFDLIVLSSLWIQPAYDAAEGPTVYASLKDGIHTTSMFAPDKIMGYTIKWLDANLKNDPAALAVFQEGGELASDTGWKDYQSKNLDQLQVGSVLSAGSVWIAAGVAVLAVAAVAVLVVMKKKKKPALAGANSDDE